MGDLKWWMTLHFIDYLPCYWLIYFASLTQHLREVTDICNSKYHPICHLLSYWDERWRLVAWFQLLLPPYGSDIDDRHALRRKPTRSERQWAWLYGQYTRLPRHPYGAIDVYDRLLLCGGVVSLSVFIYEVGSDDVKCADFTCVVFTSLHSQNYRDSAAADLKNGFSTKFWVRWDGGVVVMVYLWLIMPCDESWWRCFCEVWVAIFWDRLVLPPIDADATDLTPLISRLMVGIS